VNEVFLYSLAVAAKCSGVLVHAYCVISNHYHLTVTDPHCRLPEFQQRLNSLVARAVNASLGRWESFWAPASYSAVTLVAAPDVVSKAAYTLANPVIAGLVRSGREWPGLWSAPESVGAGPIRVARPEHFFRQDGPLPEFAELELVPPPGFSVDEFRESLAVALAEEERNAVAAAESEQRSFLGAEAVLQQHPRSRPASREPRRGLNPRIACRDKWKRIEALGRRKDFLNAYREALVARRAGVADVVFPQGTYLLRIAHGVRCEAFA
jgi:hypothetical protein